MLLKFEVDENKRKVEAAQKKRTGDGGLFGGFGGEVSMLIMFVISDCFKLVVLPL